LNFSLELAGRFEIYRLPHEMAVGCVALLVSLATFVVVSLLTTPAPLPDDVAAVMDI
jgi:hypothetical protein